MNDSAIIDHRPSTIDHRPSHNFILKFFSVVLKVIFCGILALIILTLIFTLYHHSPKSIFDNDGVTDYKYTPHYLYTFSTEGFAFGRINNDGYNNLYDYYPSMDIDTLVMGPSHMEAFQVMQDENTASVLGELTGERVYNIGVNTHFFETCINILEAALNKYKPSKYIVISTFKVSFSDEELQQILSKSVPKRPKRKTGLFLEFLRNSSYIRLISWRATLLLRKYIPDESHSSGTAKSNPVLLDKVMKYVKDTAGLYGAKAIVFYHPSTSLNLDGSLNVRTDYEGVDAFSESCRRNGIYFIDMSGRFQDEYAKDFTLPYGFINTSAGSGHLNRYGHRMIAEELYKLMQRIEAES